MTGWVQRAIRRRRRRPALLPVSGSRPFEPSGSSAIRMVRMALNLTLATVPAAAAAAVSRAEPNRSSDDSMHIPPPLPSPALIWRRRAFAFAALTLLAGCGTNNGDFGEVRGTYLRDDMHDWVGKDIFAGPK